MGKSIGDMQAPVWENSEMYDTDVGSKYLTEMEKKVVQAMRGKYHAE